MEKGSRVPPLSQRAPKVTEGSTALAESSPEGGQAGRDAVPEQRNAGSASPEAPAALPQRVRGASDGPQPPARVARPVLPASFLERVRAAAQAEAQRAEQPASSSDTFVTKPASSATELASSQKPAAGAPAPRTDGLPQRVRGAGDRPRPPARVARPVLPESILQRVQAAARAEAEADNDEQQSAVAPSPGRAAGDSDGHQQPAEVAPLAARTKPARPGDATTEPIPVITAAVGTATADPTAGEVAVPPGTAGAPAKSSVAGASPKPRALKVRPKARALKARALKAPPKPKASNAQAPKAPPEPKAARSTRPPAAHGSQGAGAGTGKTLKAQARAGRNYRMIGLLAVTVIVGALALGFVLSDHTGGSSSGRSAASGTAAGRTGAGNVRPADPATISRDAADWVTAQVGSGTVMSCDPVMCQALESRGLPADQVLVLKSGMTSPLGSAVVVATPVLRKQIGNRLSSYAPGLLASFGSGDQQIQVRAIAPNGAAQYISQVNADLAARKMSGAELAQSSRIVASATARKQLAAGEVDARLMTVITGLAASHPIDIVAFGESGPDTAMAPFRSAELAETNMQKMVTTVVGQRPPFRAAHMVSLRLPNGRSVLRIDFAAPSPFGLLGSSTG